MINLEEAEDDMQDIQKEIAILARYNSSIVRHLGTYAAVLSRMRLRVQMQIAAHYRVCWLLNRGSRVVDCNGISCRRICAGFGALYVANMRPKQ